MKKTAVKSPPKPHPDQTKISLFIKDHVHLSSAKSSVGPLAEVFILSQQQDLSTGPIEKKIQRKFLKWQKEILASKKKQDLVFFQSQEGPVWIYQKKFKNNPVSHQGLLEESVYSYFRELTGSLWLQLQSFEIKQVQINWQQEDPMALLGFLVGLELSSYQFKSTFSGVHNPKPHFHFKFDGNSKIQNNFSKIKELAQGLGQSTNWARHLVNLPPNLLNPESFSQIAKKSFAGNKNIKVEIWNTAKLKAEKMNLLLNVGQGSGTPPCLVKISYQPKKKNKSDKPIAFVGKGITFDTGGNNLKPGAGMRLMKKDMGGAATCFGIAQAASLLDYDQPLHFYLALAENSLDGKSYRPSDVIKARNGLQVEIHDTDAEGRLVLADALSVALDSDPVQIIDLATLTGAIKVALGVDLPGMFSNDDGLCEKLQKSTQLAGEPVWRMPLYSKYSTSLNSHFGDMTNCSEGSFGGAITAALFLEKFVQRKSWVHFDIYAWNDKPQGSQLQVGGSGQLVQALLFYLFENKFSDWIS